VSARAGALAAYRAALAGAEEPEAALAAIDALAADRSMRVAEIRALAEEAGLAPPPRAARGALLTLLRRPHLERLTDAEKARVAERGAG